MCAILSSAASGAAAAGATFSSVLELAAGDSAASLSSLSPALLGLPALWYTRLPSSSRPSLLLRTPLMIAASYASLDALRLILSLSPSPVDLRCSPDSSTALHCAAASGATAAPAAVKLLLSAGADPSSLDSLGRRPADVISSSSAHSRLLLLDLLSPSSFGSPSSSSSSSEEKKEYPIDPSLPDLKSSIYITDEFRMFAFKIRPCSRAYSHDWTECPFVHPGENARRRDPRKYGYSCAPCPDFRKSGACGRGDGCEYAHGVFESWLHPAQYRTRLCKDGTGCSRRVCFFAHTADEVRAVGGSGMQSPRSSRALEMAMLSLLTGSSYTPPMSPAASGGGGHVWPQPSVPMLNLPGSNIQSSRLRASLNARDMMIHDHSLILDLDEQFLSAQTRAGNGSYPVRLSNSLAPSNLDVLFSAEMNSNPSLRYSKDQGALFSPSHKAALLNQLHHQQSLLSPINTRGFSPRAVDPLYHSSLLPASSPGRMSPRSFEQLSPLSTQLAALAQQERMQQQPLQSFGSRDLSAGIGSGGGSPVNRSFSKWGSPTGKLDWGVNGEELDRLKRAATFDAGFNGEDVSWMRMSTHEKEEKHGLTAPFVSGTGDAAVIDAWLEQMQIDQVNQK